MAEDFGRFIKTLRQERDLTQIEAAQAAGISHTQWVRLEHGGGGTKPDTLEKIADALSIAPGTIPYFDLYRMSGLYPPEGAVPPDVMAARQKIADAWDVEIDSPDEYDAFDLSDDPVIQALSTGMEQQAIAEVSKLVLDGARETVAEYLKRKRAAESVGKKAE